MNWDTAEATHAGIRELRECPGFRDFLLPEIRRRIEAHAAAALTPGRETKHDRRAARERHGELKELLNFLDSAESNAAARLRKDPQHSPREDD